MTKTFCDRCGKETKSYSHIHLPTWEKENTKREFKISETYELCRACVNKVHEFLGEK